MATTYGKNLKLTIYGGSHDEKIGMTLSGIPAGIKIDMARLQAFMTRRAPGQNAYSTKRREPDTPVFLSGLEGDTTNGEEIHAVIYNTNHRSGDYSSLYDTPRPSHADYTARVKYGMDVDLRGGGHYSGRLTAPMCIAGGICLQILESRGIFVGAHIRSIAGIPDADFDAVNLKKSDFDVCASHSFPTIDIPAGELMQKKIEEARLELDSVGGVIQCGVVGLPIGLGEHMFDGIEGRISSIIFGIPAVKGIEFGLRFSSSDIRGSQNNDPFVTDGKTVRTVTNNCGGILGGMSNGMPVIFNVALKPTPSIGKTQQSVSLSRMENVNLEIKGRHDPCIVPRAVPVIEAACGIAIYDMILD